MKILYISYDGMTDPLGQSKVIPYLIGLSETHEITIISCEKSDRFQKQEGIIAQLLSSHRIGWIPVAYSTLPSVLSKQWTLARMKRKAIAVCKQKCPDVVHCRSYMASLIGLHLKQRFHIKFIFDMRGFWADERMDGNIWSQKNFLHRQLFSYFKKKEIEFLQNADHTISLTENAKQEILSWKPFEHHKIPIQVIPCCADLEHFSLERIKPDDQQRLRTELNISTTDFVISYLGSIGTWYLLDEMMDFFSCLVTQIPRAKFLFITPDDASIILEKARQKGIDEKKLIIRTASRKEVPVFLSLSALSIYFIKPAYSKKASSPTKTAEILGLGIPIITNAGIGDSAELLEKSGTGLLISTFDTENYLCIIKQFSVLLSVDKRKMIAVSHAHFSLNKGVELYQSVYDQLNNTN